MVFCVNGSQQREADILPLSFDLECCDNYLLLFRRYISIVLADEYRELLDHSIEAGTHEIVYVRSREIVLQPFLVVSRVLLLLFSAVLQDCILMVVIPVSNLEDVDLLPLLFWLAFFLEDFAVLAYSIELDVIEAITL